MKIALLARNPHLYSHRRICEAARERGHQIEVINTLSVSINITSHRPALYYRKRRLEDFDAVIPRIGASVTFYGLAVLRQFEVMGVYPLNESVAIGRSRDKLRCLQLLARRGIGLPVTAFTHDPKQAEDMIDLVGGAPVVIKLLEGTQGIGVVLGETAKSRQVGDRGVPGRQRQHPGAGIHQGGRRPADIRALVVGGKVVAAMKRTGRNGEFRSNLHRGGTGEKVTHHARRSERRRQGRPHARAQCLRRRHAALETRAAGDRGQLFAGYRGAGEGDRRRRGEPNDRFPRAPRRPGQTRTKGKG